MCMYTIASGKGGGRHTQFPNPLLKHLILPRKILRLSLIKRALVSARRTRATGQHVVVAVYTA